MLTRRLQKWFSRRFVVISEILGYTLSAIVGLGVLYTVFVDTEVLARVQGEIQPSSVAMKADTEVLLFEYIVKSGDSVKQGQPVLRVVADQASQQRIHARRLLETAVAALEIGSGADSSASLEAARHALAVLPTGKDQVETLTSPSDGFFFVPTESGQGDAISKGKNLALIYDLTQLSMDLSRSVSPLDSRIANGQNARATIKGTGERLVGRVVVETEKGSQKCCSIRFEQVTQSERDRLFTSIFSDNSGVKNSVEAEIAVGHQSLFRKTFGRR